MKACVEFLCLALLAGAALSLGAGCGEDDSAGAKVLEEFQAKSLALTESLPPLFKADELPEDLLDTKEDLAKVESAFSLTASMLKRSRQLPLETNIDLLIAQEGGAAAYGEHLDRMEEALTFLDRCFGPLADGYDDLRESPEYGVDIELASTASAVIKQARLRLETNQGLYDACQEHYLDAALLYAKLLRSEDSPKADEAVARLQSGLDTWTADTPRIQEIAAMAEGMQ